MGNIQIKRMQRRLKSMKKIKKSMITNGRRFISSNFGIGSTSHQIFRSMIKKNLRLEGLNFGISSSPHLASPSMKRQLPEVRMLVRTQSMEAVMQSTEQQQEKYRMLLEILSRLPVKSLLRFMCVCKNWKTLISSHPFRKFHREKHTSSPPLFIGSYNTRELGKLSDEDPDYHETYLIISDLEGKILENIIVPIPNKYFSMTTLPYQSKLLCFRNITDNETYLFNPSTRQFFMLTNPPSFSSPEYQVHYTAELGYISSKDEYIMVHLIKAYDKLVCEVLNISISNDNFKLHYNEWRSSIDATTNLFCVVGPCAFVGGAFYWKVRLDEDHFGEDHCGEDNCGEDYCGEDHCDHMLFLSFHVDTGCFSTFGLPQEEKAMYYATLMELKGDLYLADYPEKPAILTLWKWSSDTKLWSRYWVFDCQRLFGFTRGFRCVSSRFRSDVFIYRLKYLMGHDHQPMYYQVEAEMGELSWEDGWDEMPIWNGVVTHTNLLTL